MKKLVYILVLVAFGSVCQGQEQYTDLSMANGMSTAASPEEEIPPTTPEIGIPSDLDIVNRIGSSELTALDYTLDTMGLQYEILENDGNSYFVDIEGAEQNIKPWEIKTEPASDGKVKVTYVLIRYYHENDGDVVDLERYEPKRSKKINERKFIYNKSVGRNQSLFAVQIKD